VPWNWTHECDQALKKVKNEISEAPVLVYYDCEIDLALQVDSSKDGICAILLQNGKPIEYASRALTPYRCNWAKIEKETLAVLFCLERFH